MPLRALDPAASGLSGYCIMKKTQQHIPSIASLNSFEANYQLLSRKALMKTAPKTEAEIYTQESRGFLCKVPFLAQLKICDYLKNNPLEIYTSVWVQLNVKWKTKQKVTVIRDEDKKKIAQFTVGIPKGCGFPVDIQLLITRNDTKNIISTYEEFQDSLWFPGKLRE